MNNMSEKKAPVNKSNVITFWMIILVFSLPPVAAYFMYYTGIMPEARMNRGTLIEPKELPGLTLKTKDQQPFRIGTSNGKWTLMMLTDSLCDDLCKKNIYLMRQVRTSLGKDSANAERLLIISDAMMPESLNEFLNDYPGMPVVTGSQSDMQQLNTFFSTVAENFMNKVFIIDPRGKVMMHYEQDLQPKDLLEDLKRLILVNSNDLAVTQIKE